MNLYSDTPRAGPQIPSLSSRASCASIANPSDLFDELRHRDILLHHPYDSYDGVVGFIEAAVAGSQRRLDEADALSHQLPTRPSSRRSPKRPRPRKSPSSSS